MRNNYFEKLVNYMKKVYHIETGLNKLTDARINPTYNTAQVNTPVLFGFLLRIKSFNKLVVCLRKMNLTSYLLEEQNIQRLIQ